MMPIFPSLCLLKETGHSVAVAVLDSDGTAVQSLYYLEARKTDVPEENCFFPEGDEKMVWR
jgi:hypothetical protein